MSTPAQAHQLRVGVELTDLEDKTSKLAAFITTPTARSLPFGELNLLHKQLAAMLTYQSILATRIHQWRQQGIDI